MKAIFLFGIITMILAYIFVSFYCHTFNGMQWNNDGAIAFALMSCMGWLLGLIVHALGFDSKEVELV